MPGAFHVQEEEMAEVEASAAKKTVGKIKSPDAHRSQTYRDLERVITRDGYTVGADGAWPEVFMYRYELVGSANVQAYRIRQGRIVLPDHEGGDRGQWAARVHTAKEQGREYGDVYVRYLGVMEGE